MTGCGRTSFDEQVAVQSEGADQDVSLEPSEERRMARLAVMTDEVNEAQLGCPRVCERMEETGCEGFASLSGCYDVCEYWDTFFPRLCQPILRAYFTCRAEAAYQCDETGRPVAMGCESVAAELEECEELAPF
jgi:hypothetical protein